LEGEISSISGLTSGFTRVTAARVPKAEGLERRATRKFVCTAVILLFFCSRYDDKKNYQIRTDKPLKTCIALKPLVRIMDFLVALGVVLAAAAVIVWITKPR